MSREPAPLLRMDRVSVELLSRGGLRRVVAGVDLELGAGERLGVVGASGSGKTLLSLAILGLTPAGGRIRGRIELDGESVVDAPPDRLRTLRGGVAGLVPQEPATSLNPVFSVGFHLREALHLHAGLRGTAARDRTAELLRRVALDPATARAYPHQLSGGQAQRVGLAVALAGSPRLLVADEPTTALDPVTRGQILALLDEVMAGSENALLLISHDLPLVSRTTDRLVVLLAGRVVEEGPADDLLRAPLHPYTRWLVDPAGSPPPSAHTTSPEGCRWRGTCSLERPACVDEPPLIEAGAGRRVRCPVALEGTGAPS